MKISVLTNKSGKILGFARSPAAHSGVARVTSAIDAAAGQTVHEIELGPELAQLADDETFADELFKHSVVKKGKSATLILARKTRS